MIAEQDGRRPSTARTPRRPAPRTRRRHRHRWDQDRRRSSSTPTAPSSVAPPAPPPWATRAAPPRPSPLPRRGPRRAGLAREDLVAVGVGVPGRVDPERGRVTLAVNLGWTRLRAARRAGGRGSAARSSSRTTSAPRPSASMRAGVLGELDDLAYLAVGTGIAAGVVLDGAAPSRRPRPRRRDRPRHRRLGGPRCTCGQRGCLEAFASGPSIARRASAQIRRRTSTMPRPRATRPRSNSSTTSGDGSPGRPSRSS